MSLFNVVHLTYLSLYCCLEGAEYKDGTGSFNQNTKLPKSAVENLEKKICKDQAFAKSSSSSKSPPISHEKLQRLKERFVRYMEELSKNQNSLN